MDTGTLDPALVALASEAALQRSIELGCEHADVRMEQTRSQAVVLRNARLETSVDDTRTGIGVRVIVGGSIGFAASAAMSPDVAVRLVDRAVASAMAIRKALRRPIELSPEPPHGTIEWSSSYDIDPTTVSLTDKVGLLQSWSADLLATAPVEHVQASVLAVRETKHYANLSGTVALQHRVRVHPQLEVTAVTEGSGFEAMRTLAPPVGRGWEYLSNVGWDWTEELAELPDHLAAKLRAPSVKPGRYDLVIDPTNLWLTIHESIGHATELDRAMGYEAAYAGTSFATPDQVGTLRYGTDVMQVTGDRTVEHGLATVAVDDEGVEAQSFDLVRDGMLVGFQLDRAIAGEAGIKRSNGCAYADSPLTIPIQRMANVSLLPAPGNGPSTEELISRVEDGIFVMGDKSWSIDMQRYNFQFTGQRFYRIEHGRLAGQIRDVAYQATTTEFWNSMEAVGGEGTYLLAGAFNCGKGQPGQVAAVSHGCPSALVRSVNVLNTRSESGR